jgi:hypothetical protein
MSPMKDRMTLKVTNKEITPEQHQVVDDYSNRVKELYAKSSSNWIAIGELMEEAKTRLRAANFHTHDLAWQQFCTDVGLSVNVASKLCEIGSSDRMKRYRDQFRCVEGWSTLYAVMKLTEPLFIRFQAEYLDTHKPFTRGIVERIKHGDWKPQRTIVLLTIEGDEALLDELKPAQLDALEVAVRSAKEIAARIDSEVPHRTHMHVLRGRIHKKLVPQDTYEATSTKSLDRVRMIAEKVNAAVANTTGSAFVTLSPFLEQVEGTHAA